MTAVLLFGAAALALLGAFGVSLYWAGVRGGASRAQSLALALAAPLLVAVLYAARGEPDALNQPPPPPPPAPQSDADIQHKLAKMNEAIDSLAERLQSKPDDMDGWLMLARSCAAVGRYADAAAAYERAQTRIMGDSVQLVKWIGVRLMANNRQFDARTHELIEHAAKLAPDDPDVLLLRALAAHDQGDKAGRDALLAKLRAHYPPGTQERAELDAALEKMMPPDTAPDGPPPVPKLPN